MGKFHQINDQKLSTSTFLLKCAQFGFRTMIKTERLYSGTFFFIKHKLIVQFCVNVNLEFFAFVVFMVLVLCLSFETF